ncbi:MAG: dihydrolipoyl dehydrogenase family protein [Solirubrobacterales bacterium]
MAEQEFDVVVVGAGPAGEVLAGRVAERSNKSVAIVENHLVGGECSFYACMPSKALLRPAEVLDELGRVPGVRDAEASIDVDAVFERRDTIVNGLSDDNQVPWLESRDIALFRGNGRLAGERRVEVGDDTLVAREAVVLATGTGAAIPPVDGLAEASAWTNREVTTASEVPGTLLILGGGVVGVEMAQAWRSLGSRVTLVERDDHILGREEPFAGEQVADALRAEGVDVRTGAQAERVDHDDSGFTLVLGDGDSISGSHLLVATGRKPLTDDLGLEQVGLEPGGFVEVDEQMRVHGHQWLFAVGDVNGRALLTHMGKYQGRIVADIVLGATAGGSGTEPRALEGGRGHRGLAPRVVFTHPQVGAVGHTLASAQEAGLPVREIDLPTAGTAGAAFVGRGADQTTRFIVDTDREVLVGVTFVGPGVAEMVHAATIAVVGEVPLSTLIHAIPSFPTRSELWLNFIEAYGL